MLEGKNIFLIAGIPGTGKTFIGDFLAKNNGFTHYDIEKTGVIPEYKNLPNNSVLTWGFVPDNEPTLKIIREFISSGVKMIWFDGNRSAARKSFLRRRTVPIELYNKQLTKIGKEKDVIIEAFNPTEINTFNSKGEFKKPEDIITEILKS